MTWLVKATRDFRAYDNQCCQILAVKAGDEFVGDTARLLAETVPDAVEVLSQAPVAAPALAAAPVPVAPARVEAFDPGEHTGPDVVAYAKAHPDRAGAVAAAERDGKARTTVLAALESLT